MIFMASALMHVGLWACITIAAIHFDSIAVLWFGVLGSLVLPTFSSNKSHDDDKKD